LDKESFGFAYKQWMGERGFSPDSRQPIRFLDDPSLGYVLLRYRQVHDFWHVLCDLPPTIVGEIAVKWFEMIQTGLPVCVLSSLFGPFRLTGREKQILFRYYVPWAISAARQSVFLMNVYYEHHLSANIHSLRKALNITPAPQLN